MSRGKALFVELQNAILDEVIPIAEKIVFQKDDPMQLTQVALYNSILEQAWAMLALVDRECGHYVYPILRGQLEAYADFQILLDDANHLHRIELADLKATRERLLRANRGNPYFRSLAEQLDLDAELSKVGKRIKLLNRGGAKLLEPKIKFKKADMLEEWEAIYAFLSDHSHNGFRALNKRHIVDEEDDFRVVAFFGPDMDEMLAPLSLSSELVAKASFSVHERFETGEQDKFIEMLNRFEKM